MIVKYFNGHTQRFKESFDEMLKRLIFLTIGGDTVKIVKEEIVKSGQNEGLTYREVTYEDGGFRQFDVDSGELIGSSYDSDQNKLPKME